MWAGLWHLRLRLLLKRHVHIHPNTNSGHGLGCVHRLRIRNRRFTSDWRVFWDSRPDLTNLIGVCFGTLGACDPMLPLFRADTPHACTCGKTGFEYYFVSYFIFNRETEHELWDLWSLGSGGPAVYSWYIICLLGHYVLVLGHYVLGYVLGHYQIR